NGARGFDEPEYELVDTGAFDENRYFDVFVEYAQADVDDVLMRITVHNRGPAAAPLHVLPQLVFRNTWRWKHGAPRPSMVLSGDHVVAAHEELGAYHWYADGSPTFLFTANETNTERLYGIQNVGYAKDAFHERIVHGKATAVNPAHEGTKAAAWFQAEIPAGGSVVLRSRLARQPTPKPFTDFDAAFAARKREADEFYDEVQHELPDDDRRLVQRQAFAGMIWSKQFFYFDIPQWLNGDETQIAPPASRHHGRNWEWEHLNNADIISMPDKWEYPWFAAWDLAFHALPLAVLDASFAKEQLVLLTREWYMHPNGQMPAYEWAFGDVNPPVHAWAAWRVYKIEQRVRGKADRVFLARVFQKLLLNFTW
ncbi:MAG: MGH1-like glycoside hydrolase domain-containing protein, partial [Steroidobacteraceae bacterium]